MIQPLNTFKKHAPLWLIFVPALLLFSASLIFFRWPFTCGDYRLQFLPWAKVFSESIRSGYFPYWTDTIATGFPLLAEGQIGAYYPPNLIAYFCLPFEYAYSGLLAFHFLIAGLGFYSYSRKCGRPSLFSSVWAAVYALAIFAASCLAPASPAVLAWFPWLLAHTKDAEAHSGKNSLRMFVLFTFYIAMMLLAGSLPFAICALGVFTVILLLKKNRPAFMTVGISLVWALLLASPQLDAGWELSKSAARGDRFLSGAKNTTVQPPAKLTQYFKEYLGKRGRFVEWASAPSKEILSPNSNMTYGFSSIGGYTPFLLKRYYELTKDFGFSRVPGESVGFNEPYWISKRSLLDMIGLDVILSDTELRWNDLFELKTEFTEGFFVYRSKSTLPRAWIVRDWVVIGDGSARLKHMNRNSFRPITQVVVEEEPVFGPPSDTESFVPAKVLNVKLSDQEKIFRASISTPMILATAFAYYPRWSVRVDGVKREVIPVNHAFMGVALDSGDHTIQFYYDKSRERIFQVISLAGWALLLACLFISFINKKGLQRG